MINLATLATALCLLSLGLWASSVEAQYHQDEQSYNDHNIMSTFFINRDDQEQSSYSMPSNYEEEPMSMQSYDNPMQMYFKRHEESMKMAPEPKTKEEKKCAVKLVLPPLVIITVFLGLVLLQLVAPTLMPALVDPLVDQIVANINTFTGRIPPPPGRNADNVRSLQTGPWENLLDLTTVVSAAVSDDECFARVLCEASKTMPKTDYWTKALSMVVPKEYSGYMNVVKTARTSNKKCSQLHKCDRLDYNHTKY